MDMKRYLETITHRDFQTKMVMAGKNVATKPIPRKPIPEWLYDDLGHGYSEQERGPIIKQMSKNIVRKMIPKGDVRAIVTPQGDFFCCEAEYYIHGQIIAYAMLVGAVPELDWMSNYKWSDDTRSVDHFLCLARAEPWGWGLAESYSFGNIVIINDFKKKGKLYRKYAAPLAEFHIDIDDIDDQIFL